MHCEAIQSINQAIWACNTNKSDLYGLIRSDEATFQRLVILHFEPKPSELDWNQKTKELLINVTQGELECDVGFSLWHHIMYDYQMFKVSQLKGRMRLKSMRLSNNLRPQLNHHLNAGLRASLFMTL
jgi:hypothetical protein